MSDSNKQHLARQDKHKQIPLKYASINYYLALMFSLFPLYLSIFADGNFPFIHFDNAFTTIRHDKYYLFLILTGITAIAELLLITTYSENAKSSDNIKPKSNIFKSFSFVDYSLIALLFSSLISALFSPYTETAFFGEPNGRNNGVVLIVFYVLAYFLITRLFCYAEYVLAVFAAASIGVYLLSVLNGFYLDPLGTL